MAIWTYDISELTPVNYVDWLAQFDYAEGCKSLNIDLSDNSKINDQGYYEYEIEDQCIRNVNILNHVNAKVLNIKHKGEGLVIKGDVGVDKETSIKVEGRNISIESVVLRNVGLFVIEAYNFLLSGKSAVENFNIKATGIVKLYGDLEAKGLYITKYPEVELIDNGELLSRGDIGIDFEARSLSCGKGGIVSSETKNIKLKVEDYALIKCDMFSKIFKYVQKEGTEENRLLIDQEGFIYARQEGIIDAHKGKVDIYGVIYSEGGLNIDGLEVKVKQGSKEKVKQVLGLLKIKESQLERLAGNLNLNILCNKIEVNAEEIYLGENSVIIDQGIRGSEFNIGRKFESSGVIINNNVLSGIKFECKERDIDFITHKESNIYSQRSIEINSRLLHGSCKVRGAIDGYIGAKESLILALDGLVIGEESQDSRVYTVDQNSRIELYVGYNREIESYDRLETWMFKDGSRCLFLNYGEVVSNKIEVKNRCFFVNYNLIVSSNLKLDVKWYHTYQKGKIWVTNHAGFVAHDNKDVYFKSGSITYVGSFRFGSVDEELEGKDLNIKDIGISNVFCEPGCIFVRTDANKKVSTINAITHTIGEKRNWNNEHIIEYYDKKGRALARVDGSLISPSTDILSSIGGGLWQDSGKTDYDVGMIYRKAGEVLLLGVNFKFPASIVDSSIGGYSLGFYNNEAQAKGLIRSQSKFVINILSGKVGSIQAGIDSTDHKLLIDHYRLQTGRELEYVGKADINSRNLLSGKLELTTGVNSELVKADRGEAKYAFNIDTIELEDSQILYGKMKEKCEYKECAIYLKNKELILKPINYLNIIEGSGRKFTGALFDISGYLEALGLEEKGEYYVIGDGYYVYRQTSDAIYRILELHINSGENTLTDILAINGIREKEELNLKVGKELEKAEIDKLKRTIIWPVWEENCFKGERCINFKVYFDSKIALPMTGGNNLVVSSKENIKVLGDILIGSQGNLIAKDYLIIDGEGRFENKGVVISEKYLEISNEEASNMGIFYVKGGFKLKSDRKIVNIGRIEVYDGGFAYLESGGSIKELLLLKGSDEVRYKAIYIIDGDLYYEAGVDIIQEGSERYVNGKVVANAKGDIKRESVHTTKVKREVIKERYYLLEHEIKEYKVSDMVTGDVVYKAEGKYINLGGTIMSRDGDVYTIGKDGVEDRTITTYAENKEWQKKIKRTFGIRLGSTSVTREWSASKTSRSEVIAGTGKFYIGSEEGGCYLEGVDYKGKTNPVIDCDSLAIKNHKIQNFIKEVVVKRGLISPSVPASELIKGNVNSMPIVGSLKGTLNMQGPLDLAAPMKLYAETVRLKKDMEAANKMLGGKAPIGSQFIVAMLSKYVSAGITMGYSRTEIYQSHEEVIESEVQTEQYLKINVRGSSKTKLQGKIWGNEGTEVKAGGDVDIEGTQVNSYQRQESEYETFGINVGMDGGSINIGAGSSEAEAQRTRYTETKLGNGGIVKINIKGNLKVEAASINGEEVGLEAAKAMINDVLSKDSMSAESSGMNIGLHIGYKGGITPTGGIDFSQTEENKEFREFISGIRGGKVTIKVGELTYSTDQINGEEIKIESEKINIKERIEGREDKKGFSFSAAASVGLDGKLRSDMTARYQDNDFVISGHYAPEIVEGWKKIIEKQDVELKKENRADDRIKEGTKASTEKADEDKSPRQQNHPDDKGKKPITENQGSCSASNLACGDNSQNLINQEAYQAQINKIQNDNRLTNEEKNKVISLLNAYVSGDANTKQEIFNNLNEAHNQLSNSGGNFFVPNAQGSPAIAIPAVIESLLGIATALEAIKLYNSQSIGKVTVNLNIEGGISKIAEYQGKESDKIREINGVKYKIVYTPEGEMFIPYFGGGTEMSQTNVEGNTETFPMPEKLPKLPGYTNEEIKKILDKINTETFPIYYDDSQIIITIPEDMGKFNTPESIGLPINDNDQVIIYEYEVDGKKFQDHHIISDKNEETKKVRDLWERAGINPQSRDNKIFLPTKEEYHPTRSIHMGRHWSDVSKELAKKMSEYLEIGQKENWNQAQYKDALEEILKDERANLKSGNRALNKNMREWSDDKGKK